MKAAAIIPFPIAEDSTLNQIRAEIRALEARLSVLRASASALVHTPTPSPPGARDIEPILVAVSNHFGISIASIFSRSRRGDIVAARHTCMHLVRQRLNWSTPRIGIMFDRDHATVLHAVSVIHDRLSCDTKFASAIATITSVLDATIPPASKTC